MKWWLSNPTKQLHIQPTHVVEYEVFICNTTKWVHCIVGWREDCHIVVQVGFVESLSSFQEVGKLKRLV